MDVGMTLDCTRSMIRIEAMVLQVDCNITE